MGQHVLPMECYQQIFNDITDTKTYLNVRLSCRLFYVLNKDIKIFKDNQLQYIYAFNNNFIPQNLCTMYDKHHRYCGTIDFDRDGYTKIIDNTKINVMNTTVFYRYYTPSIYFSRIYDIITENTDENKIKDMCVIS